MFEMIGQYMDLQINLLEKEVDELNTKIDIYIKDINIK